MSELPPTGPSDADDPGTQVAVVGMACRFPGAADVGEFWRNLCAGTESITRFTDAELLAAGVHPDELADPQYVKAGAVLDGIDLFDADFFGFTPTEARITDPQQRLFLETAWTALESAGRDPARFDGSIGVFAGAALSTYLLHNLAPNPDVARWASPLQVVLGNDKDSLATRVAHVLDLRGPAYAVQSYCSTSLVAVCAAATALISGECDLALAGGAAVSVPHRVGYRYQDGGIASPDGRCRAFDADAAGAPLGNGVGVVVLRRLSDALADGDDVVAVIRGWAVNNDGALKAGYTAPGVRGQADVIAEALAGAGVAPDTIDYVEAHGTGTPLGDAAEVAALARAFAGVPAGSCALGSVKTNVGHLDRAAGVAGLIKTALALRHRTLPPTLHHARPNPQLDVGTGPFRVQAELADWPRRGHPRRAGVSAFGIGGTNAHVVLEQAPEPAAAVGRPRPRLLVASGRTPAAADARLAGLADHLATHPAADLADVAYTLQAGRAAFEHRRAVVVRDAADATAALRDPDSPHRLHGTDPVPGRPVGLLIAGVGEQYPGLAADLHATEPVFAAAVAECAAVLDPLLGVDLREVLCAPAGGALRRTGVAQPAMFALGYALSRLLAAWGITPDALVGYSVGEYVAATLAGVLSPPDALRLVAHRAALIEQLPPGAMVAAAASPERLRRLAGDGLANLDVAAVNAPDVCVLAGPPAAVAELRCRLDAAQVPSRLLETAHAFHSRLLAPAAAELTDWVRRNVALHPPRVRYLSDVTGDWMTDADATDPGYWARHMCGPVRFADAVGRLLADPDRALVEVGPGSSLGALVRQHPACDPARWATIVPTLPGREQAGGVEVLHTAVAKLWLAGVDVDWAGYHAPDRPRRVPLPGYPFQRDRYWIDPPADRPVGAPEPPGPTASGPGPELYERCWQPAGPQAGTPAAGPYLVLADGCGFAAALPGPCTTVTAGEGFAETGDGGYVLRPDEPADYARLLQGLADAGRLPATVVHLWGVTEAATDPTAPEVLRRQRTLGCAGLAHLARALSDAGCVPVRLLVATNRAEWVADADRPEPGKSVAAATALVVAQEYPGIDCRGVDVETPADLAAELAWPPADGPVAYRGGRRWVAGLVRRARPGPPAPTPLRDEATYLLTGGLGTIGLALAAHLARRVRRPRLVLTGRRGLPPRAAWPDVLASDPAGPTADRIRRVLAIEDAGARVLVLAADAADPDAMAHVVRRTAEHFGPVDGVVHCAGVTAPDAFQPIQALTADAVEAHFAAKVDALAALDRALGDRPLDFCVLQSSISAALGGLGFAAYAAANAVLDGYARLRSAGGARWTSIGWDTWRPSLDAVAAGRLGAVMAEHSMTVEDGLAAFDAALVTGAAHLLVAAGDPAARRRQWSTAVAAPRDGAHPRPALAEKYVPAGSATERRLGALWREVLGLAEVGVHDNFFDLGGTSLMGLQLLRRVGEEFGRPLAAVVLFEAPTVTALARRLGADDAGDAVARARETSRERRAAARARAHTEADDIAVIGMACRFPGADDVAQFWRNLRDGVESIRFFTPEELIAAGVPAEQVHDPAYVPARPVLDGIGDFDAGFFGYSPREAELTDPQHRVFLECAWQALEDGGYAGSDHGGQVGVFGGTNLSTYLLHLHQRGALAEQVNDYQAVIGNDKDALTTTVSYKLDLTGPSIAVQTFCSTSLVAVHLAARALRAGECDLALAGGVSIRVPSHVGHRYTEGGMESPDGHVRTFDAAARGSMFGDGAGVVLLKRLGDALEDGDTVHAVIKGSAVNNDGSLKAGFTAPSVAGQAEVVSTALEDAGVDAASISYVEAHGTATELGDPIEVAALTRAYGDAVARQSCPIGSVKTNVGHLDRAAGVSGLIKLVLALEHREIPASLHFTAPNPQIDFAGSPFYVNARRAPWTAPPEGPRRAGLNSLGMGGTNVHMIVEEAPPAEPTSGGRSGQLLLLSGRSAAALEQAGADLARYLRETPDAPLADVAYTLQVGRRHFEHRRVVRCGTVAEARAALEGADPARVLTRHEPRDRRGVGLLFAGVGEQYRGLAADLYGSEPVFRDAVDECRAVLDPLLGIDLREVLFGDGAPAGGALDLRSLLGRAAEAPRSRPEAPPARPEATAVAQPAVFVIEYAMAQLLLSWGIRPEAMAGYSVGEYVAATVAGVLTPPDALKLVAHRARLIDALPPGAMLAVSLPPERLTPLLGDALDVAAVNGPGLCVVAGPVEAVAELQQRLAAREVACRLLDTTHAFHSRALAAVADELTDWVRAEVTLSAPRIPYVSNVTGDWITPDDATDPGYWARHMCRAVRFADAVGRLLEDPDRVLVELGPGQSLGAFVRQHPACTPERTGLIVPTLPGRHERAGAAETLDAAVARLWLAGVEVDWAGYHRGERRGRVPLPTYPFQRERYWVDAAGPAAPADRPLALSGSPRDVLTALPREELPRWFFVPTWRQSVVPPRPPAAPDGTWLVFADATGVADQVIRRLAAAGARAVRVVAGDRFAAVDGGYAVRPGAQDDYARLLTAVPGPRGVVHLWSLDDPDPALDADGALRWTLDRAYTSLLWLAQSLGGSGVDACDLLVASAGAHDVTGVDDVVPERALVTGPCRVIPLEFPQLTCRQVDVRPPADDAAAAALAGRLLGELGTDPADPLVAWRGGRRWVPELERLPVDPARPAPLRDGGVYVVTGGLGGIGLAVARGLARTVRARLVLVGRTALPPPDTWPALLADTGTPEEVRRRVEAVRDLEAAGAEVLACAANVADRAALGAALEEARDRFGRIDGVVHAAGVPGMGLLQFKTPENAALALGPKVWGTRALLDCVAGDDLDFLVLFSSITSVTGGGPGQVDYCAANAYLDAVAHRAAGRGAPVVSIDWGEWQWNAWGAGLSGYAPAVQQFFDDNRRRFGITFDEGWQALRLLLAAGAPQAVVSTQDFRVLAELSRSFTIETVLTLGQEVTGRHARPELGTSYVAPNTGTERTVARLWADALGLTDVGVHDNFFELGGSSLLGVDLIARLRRELRHESLAPHVLYLAPTVHALARLVDGDDIGRADDRRDRGAQRRQSLRTRRTQ